MSTDSLTQFGTNYCVIDVDNLFICSTLEDEILILGNKPNLWIKIAQDAQSFGLSIQPGRNFHKYSGGEQVILCCLLLMYLLPSPSLPILLVRVLETLSSHNRVLLAKFFAKRLPHTQVFTLTLDGPHAAFA